MLSFLTILGSSKAGFYCLTNAATADACGDDYKENLVSFNETEKIKFESDQVVGVHIQIAAVDAGDIPDFYLNSVSSSVYFCENSSFRIKGKYEGDEEITISACSSHIYFGDGLNLSEKISFLIDNSTVHCDEALFEQVESFKHSGVSVNFEFITMQNETKVSFSENHVEINEKAIKPGSFSRIYVTSNCKDLFMHFLGSKMLL